MSCKANTFFRHIAVHLVPPEPGSAMVRPHSHCQSLYTLPDSPEPSNSEYAQSYHYTRPVQSTDGHLTPQHSRAPQPYRNWSQQTAYSTRDEYHPTSPGQYGTPSPICSTAPSSPGTNWRQTDHNTAHAPFRNPSPSSSVDSSDAQ